MIIFYIEWPFVNIECLTNEHKNIIELKNLLLAIDVCQVFNIEWLIIKNINNILILHKTLFNNL